VARRFSVRSIAAALALVAAVAAATFGLQRGLGRRRAQHTLATLADAPARRLEARLSHPSATRHHPLAPPDRAPPPLPLAALAQLGDAGDPRALYSAYLLLADPGRAAAALAHAPTSGPERNSDEAALDLARGEPAEALRKSDAALAAAPALAPARWNRALALAHLGLGFAAADAFDTLAALGEPGWADEARQRATALRAEVDRRRRRTKAAFDEGQAMIDGKLPAPSTVATQPDSYRLNFYDAVRAAPSSDRVRALLPIAAALDAPSGATVLQDYARRVAALDFRVRAPLAAEYAALLRKPRSLGDKTDAFFDRLRAAHADDLLLGALIVTRLQDAHIDEYRRLALATHDPWFTAMAEQYQARAEQNRGELEAAERRLGRALIDCRRQHIEYRCLRLLIELASHLIAQYRLNEAQALATDGLAETERVDFNLEQSFVHHLANIWRYRADTSMTTAYVEEELGRSVDPCGTAQAGHELLATMAFQQLHPDEARRQLALVPRECWGRHFSGAGAWVLANLTRYHGTAEEQRQLDETLRQLRRDDTRAAPFNDMIEGRALLERDAPAGRTLLRQAIASAETRPRSDSIAPRARSAAYFALIMDAARDGRAAEALDDFAAQLGVHTPERCALAVAVDDNRMTAVTRDANGRAAVRFGPRTVLLPPPDELVPPEVRARLAGCAEVHVLALPPLHGNPDLLPPEIAWSYGAGDQLAGAGGPPDHQAASGNHVEPAATPSRGLLVADVEAPASLRLPRLTGRPALVDSAGALVLRGADATPQRVLAELPAFDEVELDVHGLVDLGRSDASVLVLAPDADGRFALSAAEIGTLRLPRHPLVLLGSCQAARTAPWLHEAWGLPTAFVAAGARVVFASPTPIPDASASAFFGALLSRIHAGESPAVALRNERQAFVARGAAWVRQIMAFE
jgi:hypothetical protein